MLAFIRCTHFYQAQQIINKKRPCDLHLTNLRSDGCWLRHLNTYLLTSTCAEKMSSVPGNYQLLVDDLKDNCWASLKYLEGSNISIPMCRSGIRPLAMDPHTVVDPNAPVSRDHVISVNPGNQSLLSTFMIPTSLLSHYLKCYYHNHFLMYLRVCPIWWYFIITWLYMNSHCFKIHVVQILKLCSWPEENGQRTEKWLKTQ